MARPGVFLGLGSNLGDRQRLIERAIARLEQRGFRVSERSSLYQTEPVGGPPQGPYLNMVVAGECALGPEELLGVCLETERELERTRDVRHGPRTIDIDLLLYGDEQRDSAQLTLPHPRLHQRLFVLVPLAEIAPTARHPRLQLTAAELRQLCPDTSQVVRCDAGQGGGR
jgi:2-amino-4-hydroxy-6-hydroxymethyldihydropteridine diphosphokinase